MNKKQSKNPHAGSTFESFLKEAGIYEEVQAAAIKKVLKLHKKNVNKVTKRPTFEKFKQKALQNKEVRDEYERLRPEFEILQEFIKARKKARCSQLVLAERLNMQQPAVARLERGGYSTTSIVKLAKIADALGYSMKVSLKPKRSEKNSGKNRVKKL